jgi:uncharacterized protein (TIGR02594 family)
MNFRTVQPNDPAWLVEAFSVLGLSEIAGGRHEKRILAMYRAAGHEIAADEVPWCAAFVNWCLSQAGIDGTGSLMARSFTKYGKGLHRTDTIPRGAIAIWPRGKPPSGHVNIVLHDDGTYVWAIGGNQSKEGTNGAVTIGKYAKGQAVAYRWPLGAPPKPKPKPIQQPDIEEPEIRPQPDIEEPEIRPQPDVEPPGHVPDPDPQPIPVPAPAPHWYERIWVRVLSTITAIGGAIYDYRVALTIIGGLLVAAAAFVWFMGPDRVRAWVRRQFK